MTGSRSNHANSNAQSSDSDPPNDAIAGLIPYKSDTHTESWNNLPQDRIEHLPAQDRANAKRLIEQSAHSELASLRITDLTPTAQRQTSPHAKAAIKLGAALLSGLMFSAGTQMLTSRLGRWSPFAAMSAAAVAGLLVEDRGTKAVTRLRQRFDTQKAWKALESYRQENPPINEFEERSIQAQFDLLRQVESGSFVSPFPIDGALAGGLSLAEYITAFWIVTQLNLSGGLLLEAIAASLPIAILWMTAAFQSESFELPERHAELIAKYQPHVFHPERLSENEVRDIYRLDSRIQFVSQGDPSGQLKNLGMAEAAFLIDYYHKRKQQFEQAGIQSLAEITAQYRELIAQLPGSFFRQAGLSDEEFLWEQRQWVEQQTRQLNADLEQDIESLGKQYSQKIQVCEDAISKAQKSYKESYQHWLSHREYANNNRSGQQISLDEARSDK